MDFDDVSARLKKAREAESEASRPVDHGESYRIRAKMVGVLLRDARVNAGRSVEDCAQLLGIAPEDVAAWEQGDNAASLPQLELLAYYLDVPISHFWGTRTLEVERERHTHPQSEYLALRDRMIGALLRQARQEQDLSLDALSESSGLPADVLHQYELGELSVPMHELTVLAGALKRNMRYFLESSSYIGELLTLREELKRFATLPEEIREFASNPLNVGFIEIALMLSQMPADRLRRVGESVLNITM